MQSPDADDESYRRRYAQEGDAKNRRLLRSTSRASVYSAYDGYYDERERRRQQRYDDKRDRRPDSRGASEYGYDKR